MSVPQFNTISLLGAGEARFDGAGAVITLGTAGSAPTWTSLGTTAAWQNAFAQPTAAGITQYVVHADFYVGGTGASVFVTKVATPTNAPTAANGFEWPVGYGESVRNSPELLRNMQIYVPASTKLYVVLYWGSL